MDKRAVPNPPRSVADLMHSDLVTVGPKTTLRELARILRAHQITGVPVVDERGKALGIVSVTDLLWLSDRVLPTPGALQAASRWERLDRMTVLEVMTPDVFGVAADASVEELLEFFSRTGLHRVPVLAGDRVVGVVSTTDLLGLIAGEDPDPQERGR